MSRISTHQAMQGRWREALSGYGMTEKQLSGKHTECPLCGGSDRFRWDNKDGNGTYFCNGCGAGDGFRLAMALTGKAFKDLAAELDSRVLGLAKDEPRQKPDWKKLVARIYQGNLPVSDIDPVVLYLRGRGIQSIPRRFLRFNPSVWNWCARSAYPAMVAALFDVNGKRKGYHLTFITKEGRKACIEDQKLYTPGETGDCVIRLSDVAPHIGLAEGIETALSVTQLYGIPCWATGDAGRMERFKLPAGIEKVSIFADIDHTHTGEAAAELLAKRLIVQEKIHADVIRDCPRGQDYNDLLLSKAGGMA